MAPGGGAGGGRLPGVDYRSVEVVDEPGRVCSSLYGLIIIIRVRIQSFKGNGGNFFAE